MRGENRSCREAEGDVPELSHPSHPAAPPAPAPHRPLTSHQPQPTPLGGPPAAQAGNGSERARLMAHFRHVRCGVTWRTWLGRAGQGMRECAGAGFGRGGA